MKIRNGFVSNSSSSSFIIVGISGGSNFGSLLKALNVPNENDDNYWNTLEQNFDNYDNGAYKHSSGLVVFGGYEPYYIGVDAESMFAKNMTLSEIKIKVQQLFKDVDVNVTLDKINMFVEEISSE